MSDKREYTALHRALDYLLGAMREYQSDEGSAKVRFATGDVFTLHLKVKPKRRRSAPSNVGRAGSAAAAQSPQDASGPTAVAPAPEPRPHGNATP